MDFILLYLLKKVNHKNSSLPRLLGAATVGAVMACIVGIYPWMNALLKFFLMYIASGVLMIWIAFGKLKLPDLLKQVIVLYFITYFIGGLINSIYYYTNLKYSILSLGRGILYSNVSWTSVAIAMLVIVPVILFTAQFLLWYRKHKSEIFEIELFLEGNYIRTKGLLDTGNCLYDPLYKKPVIIVEDSITEKLLPNEFLKCLREMKYYLEANEYDTGKWEINPDQLIKFRFIPYSSIGKKQGMMVGILLDKVQIHTGKEVLTSDKVIAAISENQLSAKEEYHAILHKELM
jgi:stage II sporulation protein GA (sporulation sigma-E factor processing peptidase)